MIKNILFDFDGVLAESVGVKTEAFRKLYNSYGNQIADKVVEHHLSHGGISRFEKIKLYHSKFLGVELKDYELNAILERFSELVLESVIKAEAVAGSLEFLANHGAKYKMWIITGTPTNEMKLIASKRKITNYFIDIFGSPEDKNTWTKHILANWKINPWETVFIGDATSDYEAAEQNNIHFILRRNTDNKHLFRDFSGIELNDLTNLENLLNNI